MENKENRIIFYNTGYDETRSGAEFGCATLGFTSERGWVEPQEGAALELPYRVKGAVFHGNMEPTIQNIKAYARGGKAVKGGILFLGNCGGEEAFIEQLGSIYPGIPFVGGSPAIGEDSRVGRMLPENGEVSILLITDERYDLEVEYCNVHRETVGFVKVCGTDSRYIETVEVDGAKIRFYDYIHTEAKKRGVKEGIHERIAISDHLDRNIHLIPDGGNFICGANLPEERGILVRYTDKQNVFKAMEAFYASEDSVIFGCAGIKSMLDGQTFITGKNSAGLFMFGEVAFLNGSSQFANLMLAKMKFLRKGN
ncbi:hypothetical protein [Christensenella intestinihominis]|uniref:hypothetical protein n=1 Tax=Christensenella intestinihominis TaxID=1851429 RepID=UPI00082B84A3|nr:hypothetical protein [Christensenella intestinihominis]